MKGKLFSKVIAFVGACIAAYGVWGIYQRFSPPKVDPGYEFTDQQDWVRVNAKEVDRQLFWASLERLASKQDQRVVNILMPLLSSADSEEQSRAHEILGLMPDFELSLGAFRQCLFENKSNLLVISCLKGLAKVQSDSRASLIRDWLSKQKPHSPNYWLGLESLYSCLKNGPERTKILEEAFAWVKTNIKDDVEKPFRILSRIKGENKELHRLAIDILDHNSYRNALSAAVFYLAQTEDTEVYKKLPHWLESNDKAIISFFIQSIPVLCPPERMKLIDTILGNIRFQDQLNEILSSVKRLGEGGSIPVLEKNLNQSFRTPMDKAKIEELITELKKGVPPDAQSCRGRQ